MKFYTKRTFFLLISVIGLSMMISCKSKTPWNPYLSAKEKPNDKQGKEEQKQIVKGTKNYEKLMEKNKKDYLVKHKISLKQQYKKKTKIKRRKRSKKVKWRF